MHTEFKKKGKSDTHHQSSPPPPIYVTFDYITADIFIWLDKQSLSTSPVKYRTIYYSEYLKIAILYYILCFSSHGKLNILSYLKWLK